MEEKVCEGGEEGEAEEGEVGGEGCGAGEGVSGRGEVVGAEEESWALVSAGVAGGMGGSQAGGFLIDRGEREMNSVVG
jgi:hypothetical protein